MFDLSGEDKKKGHLEALMRLIKKMDEKDVEGDAKEMMDEEGSEVEESLESPSEESSEGGMDENSSGDDGSGDGQDAEESEEGEEDFSDLLKSKNSMPKPKSKVMAMSIMVDKKAKPKGRKKGSKGKY